MRKTIYIYYTILMCGLFFSVTTGYAQVRNRGLEGDVVDLATGLPIPDVSISTSVGGRTIGKTDAKGKFVLSFPSDAKVLVFTNVEYETITKELTASPAPIRVQMTAKENNIEEVMVIGYQQRTRETLIGSVAVITAKDIKDVPAANVMELLQGKVAGLNIQNNNGMPGMRGSMSIRGVSNFNVSGGGDEAFMSPSSPLFVIDGIPLDDNGGYEYGFNQAGPGISPLSLIPTEDIERIEVLKDAQATALYGSRGAYGVILITTKRGNSKIPIVQLTSNFFVSTPPALRNVIGGAGERRSRIDQILAYDTTLNRRSGYELIDRTVFLSDSLNPYFNNNTDWQSYFYRTTYNQTHNLNVSGGDQQFNYKVNSGIFSEKGIQRSTGFTRYSLQMNSQYRPNEKFRMFAALNGSVGLNTEGSGNGLLQSGVASGGNTSSLLPPPSLFNASNGLLSTLEVESLNKTSAFNVNTEFEYEFIKNLRAITSMGYNYKFANKDKFNGAALNNNVSDLYAYNDRDISLYNRNQLRYNLDWNDSDNQLNLGLFNEINVKTFRADVINQIGSANDNIRGPIGINYWSSKGGTLNNLSEVRTASFAASANYSYKMRYVLEANYRLDGTSSNGPLNPWSYNPSLGGKWNINREEFAQDWTSWMDFGALRLTWGRNIVPTGNIFDVYGRYVTSYKYNNIQTVTLNNNYIPNLELQPQRVTQWNYGLDLGLFRNLMSITYDAYYKEVIGELTSVDIANHNSFKKLRTNEQALVNYGHELMLQFRPIRNKNDWNWTFSVNGAYNRDVITRLPDDVRQVVEKDGSDYQLSTLYRLGRNSSTFVLLHNTGVYATDDDVPVDPYTGLRMRVGGGLIEERFLGAGDPIWTDLNGDFIIDDRDYVYVGNYQPLFTGGFTSFVSWKDWQVTVNASFTLKRDILNTAASDLMKNFSNPAGRQDGNIYSPSLDKSISAWVPVGYYDYWMNNGDISQYPNPYDYLRSGHINPFRSDQTLFIEDGSYLKINSATVSYNIPRTFSQRYGITSFRIYLTAANLYNFNNYSGPDPESISNTGRDSSKGYPNKRSFTFGLNVQF